MTLIGNAAAEGCCFVLMGFPRRWGRADSAFFNSVARYRNEAGKLTYLQHVTLRTTFVMIPLSR